MIHVLLIETDPLLRELIADLAEQAQLRIAAAVASVDEARALLSAMAGRSPRHVLVVAAPRAFVRAAGDSEPGERAPGAEWSWLLHAGANAGPAAPGPAGVVYFGERVSALRGEGLGPRERFLAVPFGREALAAAVYGVLDQPVPRWLAPRRREVRPGALEAGR